MKVVETATSAVSFVYTNYTGNFIFVASRSGTHTITPFDSTCDTCSFTPTSRTVTVNTTAVSGQDFIEQIMMMGRLLGKYLLYYVQNQVAETVPDCGPS